MNEIPFQRAYKTTKRVQVICYEKTLTQQHLTKECDVNQIINKYDKKGVLRHINKAATRYMDVTSSDFQEAAMMVTNAMNMFAELPSELRNRFDNDPARLLDFVHDPDNADELAVMGLARVDLNESTEPGPASTAAEPDPGGAAPAQDGGAT